MKKFKTRKEIIENPESKNLAYELLLEENPNASSDLELAEEIAESNVKFFIERKLKQCKNEGV